jgi:hypothetical protein
MPNHTDQHYQQLLAFAQFGAERVWPKTHAWMAPKRYMTPHGFWSAQEISATAEADFIVDLVSGNVLEDVYEQCFIRSQLALGKHGVQTWHVGKDLTRALFRTTPPTAWPVERFKMPFAGLRIILEKGAFVMEDGAEIMAIQAGFFEKGEPLAFPKEISQELMMIADSASHPEPRLFQLAANARHAVEGLATMDAAQRELCFVTWVAKSGAARPEANVFQPSLSSGTIGDFVGHAFIRELVEGTIVSSRPREPGDRKRAIIENALPFFVNLVLLLTAKPDYTEEGELARAKRMKGGRIIDALYKPRFLGKKFAYSRQQREEFQTTGRKLPPGWRAGHWKDIPYGPLRQLRYHDWIEPYQYGS